jgi:hypothetical protein
MRRRAKPLEEEWEPPLPDALAYIWEWFSDLSPMRPNSGFGPLRVPPTEIKAWAGLRHIDLSPFEARALTALDAAWLEIFVAAQANRPTTPPVRQHGRTARPPDRQQPSEERRRRPRPDGASG